MLGCDGCDSFREMGSILWVWTLDRVVRISGQRRRGHAAEDLHSTGVLPISVFRQRYEKSHYF
jgi:hypothetical protein